jgi:hypothetical protein
VCAIAGTPPAPAVGDDYSAVVASLTVNNETVSSSPKR